ncbi:hypothetical protein [Arthrobacter rhombi]
MMQPDLRTAAIYAHEILTSYIGAGFTREEAFDLVKTAITQSNAAGGGQ